MKMKVMHDDQTHDIPADIQVLWDLAGTAPDAADAVSKANAFLIGEMEHVRASFDSATYVGRNQECVTFYALLSVDADSQSEAHNKLVDDLDGVQLSVILRDAER